MKWQIENATLYPDRAGHGLVFANGNIDQVLSKQGQTDGILSINLHGLPVFPGLINSHDSLLATYFPLDRVHAPYRNWLAFDNELKSSHLFQKRLGVDIADLYSLGGYKNIINGATYVVDHIPHFVRKPHAKNNIAQLLPDYGISHSVCSYNLNWGDGFRKEHDYAVENNLPYILHIAEGFDIESQESLLQLDDMGALSENTVLVHGVGLSDVDLELIAKRGAHLVWCPVSNINLYNRTFNIKLAIELGINICIGTDTTMTGATGLLHEINFAWNYYRDTFKEELDFVLLSKMVIDNPIRAFRIPKYGDFTIGNMADCVVLNNHGAMNPAQALVQSNIEDVFLVIRNGQPVYADESLNMLFHELDLSYTQITIKGKQKLLPQDYEKTMNRIHKNIESTKEFPFLPAG